MKRVFADAGYWIALLNPADALHDTATQASGTFGRTRIITSELVLAEVLNAFARKGSASQDGVSSYRRDPIQPERRNRSDDEQRFPASAGALPQPRGQEVGTDRLRV